MIGSFYARLRACDWPDLRNYLGFFYCTKIENNAVLYGQHVSAVTVHGNLVPRSPTVIRKGDLVKFDFEHVHCQRGPKFGLFYHCACSYSLL